jgi:hypothetical protein
VCSRTEACWLGKLEEAMFLMEAQNNSGTVSVTTAAISVE